MIANRRAAEKFLHTYAEDFGYTEEHWKNQKKILDKPLIDWNIDDE